VNDQAVGKLFASLDLDKDDFLSRSDLNNSVQSLGWSWQAGPLLAVLDLLSIPKPISRPEFAEIIQQIRRDPLGPYGNILLRSLHFEEVTSGRSAPTSDISAIKQIQTEIRKEKAHVSPGYESLYQKLKKTAGTNAALQYRALLEPLEIADISLSEVAMLIIDPQRSFTEGAWMQSIGYEGEQDVAPIRLAFDNCAAFLKRYYGSMAIMFTRCPFPADSYGWAQQIENILNSDQLYFIKPGNSVLFPPTNGFAQWVEYCLESGIDTLAMAGCTLNSCVRVSAIETARKFQNQNLKVMVDLSLCGARMRNYNASPEFNGRSAVASAVNQMRATGVDVVRRIKWREPC